MVSLNWEQESNPGISAQQPGEPFLTPSPLQYINPANPIAHYESTAAEILHALDNKVDMVVIGAGTGGSITGIGRRLKEVCPDVKVAFLEYFLMYNLTFILTKFTLINEFRCFCGI